MTIVEVITVICICVLLVISLPLMAFALIEFLKSIEGRRMVRTMKDVCSTILSCMSPSTPLQKEIREEERTIKQLEAQKVDMERLAALKRKREALFEEAGDEHAARVEGSREEVRREYGTGRMHTIRKCPKCEEGSMVYYGGMHPAYDWLCCNCRYSEFEDEL